MTRGERDAATTGAPPRRPGRSHLRQWVVAVGLVGAGVLAACSSSPDTTVAPAPEASSTTSTTVYVPPTTTTTAPTVPVVLPQPVAAPVDDYGYEPEVVVGSISIPAIDVEAPLYEGVRLTTLDRGPGHWPGTAMPGQPGNVVVAGHRVTHSRPFYDLDQLQSGDQVIFTVNGKAWTYEVTGTEVVGADALWIVDQTSEPTATLFACHPKGSAEFRIVAHLRLRPGVTS